MKLKRFEHVNLACRDIDKMADFYQTLFPDWFVRAEGTNQGMRWIHLGDRQFYLSLNDAPDLQRTHVIYEAIGISHIGFVIEDGDQMKALLEEKGIGYYTYTSPETKHRIYVSDPDGNEIELLEYQEAYELK
mgnify:CR=1 FL=1